MANIEANELKVSRCVLQTGGSDKIYIVMWNITASNDEDMSSHWGIIEGDRNMVSMVGRCKKIEYVGWPSKLLLFFYM